jgi:hypothetical protein
MATTAVDTQALLKGVRPGRRVELRLARGRKARGEVTSISRRAIDVAGKRYRLEDLEDVVLIRSSAPGL